MPDQLQEIFQKMVEQEEREKAKYAEVMDQIKRL
jgi:protein-arginine kinase activator protein McsA